VKPVLVWLKVALVQFVVLWHCWHVVGKPACTWLGFVAPLKSVWWH
jgi:hypothetical protein